MSSKKIFLNHISYQLGESEHSYLEASGFEEVTTQKRMPKLAEMWGWGSFFSTKQRYELAYISALKTLEKSQIPRESIDLTIFCSCFCSDSSLKQYEGAGSIINRLGLGNSAVVGLSLSGCASTLSAIHHASKLVESGAYSNVLLVVIDVIPSGMERFNEFSLLSDATVSAIISSNNIGGSEILNYAYCVQIDGLTAEPTLEDAAKLARKTSDKLYQMANFTYSDVDRFFSNNLFLPIKKMRDLALGYSSAQLFLENSPRIAHCFSCDSLINYADYITSRIPPKGGIAVMQADSNGFCAALALAYA